MHPPDQDPTDLRRPASGRRRLAVAAVAVALGALTFGAGTAPAASSSLPRATIKAAQAKLGLKADGVAGPRTRSAVRRFERRHHLAVDGRLDAEVLRRLGLATRTAASAAGGDTVAPSSSGGAAPAPVAVTAPALDAEDTALLAAIAQCESGGDPAAVSPSGRYRGKYQFSRATWKRMGGTGDPAKAPEAEQDARAARLLVAQGPKAWPVCSKKAAAAAPAPSATPVAPVAAAG